MADADTPANATGTREPSYEEVIQRRLRQIGLAVLLVAVAANVIDRVVGALSIRWRASQEKWLRDVDPRGTMLAEVGVAILDASNGPSAPRRQSKKS